MASHLRNDNGEVTIAPIVASHLRNDSDEVATFPMAASQFHNDSDGATVLGVAQGVATYLLCHCEECCGLALHDVTILIGPLGLKERGGRRRGRGFG